MTRHMSGKKNTCADALHLKTGVKLYKDQNKLFCLNPKFKINMT